MICRVLNKAGLLPTVRQDYSKKQKDRKDTQAHKSFQLKLISVRRQLRQTGMGVLKCNRNNEHLWLVILTENMQGCAEAGR